LETEPRKKLALNRQQTGLFLALKMEAKSSSEMLIEVHWTSRRDILEAVTAYPSTTNAKATYAGDAMTISYTN
jgi:hypothetical protein